MPSSILHPRLSTSLLAFPHCVANFSTISHPRWGSNGCILLRHFRDIHLGCCPQIVPCASTNSKVAMITDSRLTNLKALIKEPHKYFDQVIITVRSGDGGHGAVLSLPSQKNTSKSQAKNEQEKRKKGSFRRDSDGSLILPMGGHGGDVVLYADESTESLLEFHKKRRYNAKRGGNVDAMGMLTSQLHDGSPAPALRIPVPVGTVVKRKKGKLLADLARAGDEILVARGGQGGISLLEMPEHRRKRLLALSTNVMRDESDKVLVLGQPGEEVSLELVLRVVADVGLVGLPNAGKSTLLAAITHAKPDIAGYPFTTLMPNLGRLGGDPTLGALKYSSGATLADLPGLIEGAHLGKGLGRNFLRHLRRTRLLVHVVDAASEDPVNDYMTVKEELRMYNPEYLERPYIVVLNKIDIPKAQDRLSLISQEISTLGCIEPVEAQRSKILPIRNNDKNMLPSLPDKEEKKEKDIQEYPRPLAVVCASLLKHVGVDDLLKEIRNALRKCQDIDIEDATKARMQVCLPHDATGPEGGSSITGSQRIIISYISGYMGSM
ncbi:Developmentally regulated G-protein 1 [Apostasia shenzhenica]|uniref:Developmentally regulated G-protein 1 n=1 Tax=Apostasia shenzhenica TaxID=1088818 RepID=A0A2I0BCM9_9ASPA|nr:Developmentally regulated G-protein 1 [Apostasia shenzhenica]